MNRIAQLIKEVMRKEGWTSYRLAKAIGIFRGNLTKIFSDKGNPTWRTIEKILDILGYEVILKRKEVKKGKRN